MNRSSQRHAHYGFTLIEAAVATVVIGLGIVALLAAMGAGARNSQTSQQLTQAVLLTQEIREWTVALPFSDPDPGDQGKPPGSDGSSPQVFVDDLDDLMGVTYSPPRDGRGNAIAGLHDWAQTITITWLDPTDFSVTLPPGDSNLVDVRVDITYQGRQVASTSWLISRR
jgi:type II secretory pathway pseudopilin PulG